MQRVLEGAPLSVVESNSADSSTSDTRTAVTAPNATMADVAANMAGHAATSMARVVMSSAR